MMRRRILNPVEVAIEGASKLPATDVAALKAILDVNLSDFSQGRQCADAWTSMAAALNMAESLADVGICSDAESRASILRGQHVLAAVAERHSATGSWTLRYDQEQGCHEREMLDRSLWIHTLQLEHCSRREYERAMAATQARVAGARRGQVASGTKVVTLGASHAA